MDFLLFSSQSYPFAYSTFVEPFKVSRLGDDLPLTPLWLSVYYYTTTHRSCCNLHAAS